MKIKAYPSKQHLEWADCELGVIIHLELQVYEPTYSFRSNWDYLPSPEIFNPVKLDTDQWLETAVAAGAKYAVLVTKGCSGFTLWPSKAHEYGIHSSKWRNGKGDIVADFVKSCRKYSVRPGLYYSVSCNARWKVDNPGIPISRKAQDQAAYNAMVIQQLTELWSNYGDIFEIWFDGGILSPANGGPEIAPLIKKFQPGAVCFQGPPECPALRWPGSERGVAPYPSWSTTDAITNADGTVERYDCEGSPDGDIWAPAEADMPNRIKKSFSAGWLWKEGEDHLLEPVEHLVESYYRSVGHNANLLIGMQLNSDGLVPNADCKQFRDFGQAIKQEFANPAGKTSGRGNTITLKLTKESRIAKIVLMEDQTEGQKVRKWEITGLSSLGCRHSVAYGSSIGHKHIVRINPSRFTELELNIMSSVGEPEIRSFEVYS